MEVRNHNHMQISPESTWMSPYEYAYYYRLQHEPLDRPFDTMQPNHYGRPNPGFNPYGIDYTPHGCYSYNHMLQLPVPYVPQSPYNNYWGSSEIYGNFNFQQMQLHQQQEASSSSSHQIENRPLRERYMTTTEYMNDSRSAPRFDMTLQYHIEDDVMILHRFAPASNAYGFDRWVLPEDPRLKRRKYVSSTNPSSAESSSLDEDRDMCVVCQSEYENGEEVAGLHCGHEFHVECIEKWLKWKEKCPMCRADAMSL